MVTKPPTSNIPVETGYCFWKAVEFTKFQSWNNGTFQSRISRLQGHNLWMSNSIILPILQQSFVQITCFCVSGAMKATYCLQLLLLCWLNNFGFVPFIPPCWNDNCCFTMSASLVVSYFTECIALFLTHLFPGTFGFLLFRWITKLFVIILLFVHVIL